VCVLKIIIQFPLAERVSILTASSLRWYYSILYSSKVVRQAPGRPAWSESPASASPLPAVPPKWTLPRAKGTDSCSFQLSPVPLTDAGAVLVLILTLTLTDREEAGARTAAPLPPKTPHPVGFRRLDSYSPFLLIWPLLARSGPWNFSCCSFLSPARLPHYLVTLPPSSPRETQSNSRHSRDPVSRHPSMRIGLWTDPPIIPCALNPPTSSFPFFSAQVTQQREIQFNTKQRPPPLPFPTQTSPAILEADKTTGRAQTPLARRCSPPQTDIETTNDNEKKLQVCNNPTAPGRRLQRDRRTSHITGSDTGPSIVLHHTPRRMC
jgi:hypothetical protein